jgi:CHASE3 domain sensor protein
MAEPHEETRQEKETRWAAQRVAHEKEQQGMQAARQRKTARTWLIIGAIVIIVAVIAAVVLRSI